MKEKEKKKSKRRRRFRVPGVPAHKVGEEDSFDFFSRRIRQKEF